MNSTQTRTRILDEAAIGRKLRRMALEVAERNAGEAELVFAGIVGNGQTVAKCIAEELKTLAGIEAVVIAVELDKRAPMNVSVYPSVDLAGKVVILTDDVANTGRTMFYALKPFLQTTPKKVQTLALVERSHKLFPVQTDYTGLSIATTLQEHIAVETEGEKIVGAWLY